VITGALDGANRVDMETARLAAKTGGSWQQDVLRTHLGYIGGVAAFFLPLPSGGEVARARSAQPLTSHILLNVQIQGVLLIDRPETLTR